MGRGQTCTHGVAVDGCQRLICCWCVNQVRVPAGADFDTAQTVDIMFMAPKAGRYDLTLMCLSDCYIGCDTQVKVQLRVLPQTRAMAEGRVARQQAAEETPAAVTGKAYVMPQPCFLEGLWDASPYTAHLSAFHRQHLYWPALENWAGLTVYSEASDHVFCWN
jgi:hypothetical protein